MAEKRNLFAGAPGGVGFWGPPQPGHSAPEPLPTTARVAKPSASAGIETPRRAHESPVVPVSDVPDVAAPPFQEAHGESPPPARFALVTRKGEYWSYPYAFVGLIDCRTPAEIVIHCNCGAVERIVIKGRGLDRLAAALTAQRVVSVTEADRNGFTNAMTTGKRPT